MASMEAYFDTLFITDKLDEYAGQATLHEISAFAYLGCLLSVYEGNPTERWSYQFMAVPPMLPYANEITDSARQLVSRGLIEGSDSDYRISARGRQELFVWAQLHSFEWRRRFLEGATGTGVLLPPVEVMSRMRNEPQLKRASLSGSTRELMTEATTGALFEQLHALQRAVGTAARDLLVPASVYLRFLLDQELQESNTGSTGGGELPE